MIKSAANLYGDVLAKATKKSAYFDHRRFSSPAEQAAVLARATTVYVGNLSFFTREEQINELFSHAGRVPV